MLTILAIPSLVYSTVVCVSTLTRKQSQTMSTSVIRVLTHMLPVSSIAHTFHSQWYVRSVRTPSSRKLDLRLVTVWFQTHSSELLHQAVWQLAAQTNTTVSSAWTTSSLKVNNKIKYKLRQLRLPLF